MSENMISTKTGDGREMFAGRALNSREPAPAGNQATGTLKLIALGFMLIDHLGAVVFPGIPELRIIGRIAFPIYCWCLVVGFHYTSSVPWYLCRVLLCGFAYQPLYAYVMDHIGTTGQWMYDLFFYKPNIFLTLFLGLAAIWGLREKKYFSHFWAPVLTIILATVLDVDYGWRGVLFIMLLYTCRNSRPAIAAVMTAFFLYWGTGFSVTSSLFGIPLNIQFLPAPAAQPLSAFMRLETYGLISLAFILPRYRRNVHMPLWVSYGLYPTHLLVLLLIKTLVG